MKLLLATSNLYKTDIQATIDKFASYAGVDGVQLCPGNTGTLLNVPIHFTVRYHENYENWGKPNYKNKWLRLGRSWYRYIGSNKDNSVHPPILLTKQREEGESIFGAPQLELPNGVALEVMPMGTINYPVCTVQTVRYYMSLGQHLAIDLSHIDINIRAQNTRFEWEKLLADLYDYPYLTELHMSQAIGLRDMHAPITRATFGLDFVKSCRDKVEFLVLESNMHNKTDADIQRQIDILLE